MNLEEKYQMAVKALKEISLKKCPYKINKADFVWNVISSMKKKAQKTLMELGEIEEAEGQNKG